MSTIKVEIVKPYSIEHHFNADKLDILVVSAEGGFSSIVKRDQFSLDDLVLYIPPDAVLTDMIMEHLSKNKIMMRSNRLRAINIRGAYSEGLCLKPEDWLPAEMIFDGSDVGEYLGIKKYVPKPNPRDRGMAIFKTKGTSIRYKNENFARYTDIERFERHPKIFRDTPEVVATKKYHGCNFRAGIVKVQHLSWWQKFKQFFHRKDCYEFLVGSHNVIRKPSKKWWKRSKYKEDLYWKVALKYNLPKLIKEYSEIFTPPKSVIFFGEIIGAGIQKGYDYFIPKDDPELRIFDIKVDGEWLSWNHIKAICGWHDLPVVEEVYRGPWSVELKSLAQAVDVYGDKKYNREGIVVKDAEEKKNNPYHRRTIVKVINPVYASDKKNTEYQ
jgi:RNA ligase (TIGR02306 family)